MRKCFLVALFLYFSLSAPVQAVIISEVYPQPQTGETEWIELFNDTNETSSIAGWQIFDQLTSASLLVTLTGFINPNSYKLIRLSQAKLNNTGDGVTLIDQTGLIKDEMAYSYSQAGLTWALIDHKWQVAHATPERANQANEENAPPTPSPQFIPTPTLITTPSLAPTAIPSPVLTIIPSLTPTAIPSPTSKTKSHITPNLTATPTVDALPHSYTTPSASFDPTLIQLSEIMACPSHNQDEWFELYNPTHQTLALNHWQIKDAKGQSVTFSLNLMPQTYQVVHWSKSLLNNSGDEFNLFSDKNFLVNHVVLSACQLGLSWQFLDQHWYLDQPTKGQTNHLTSTNSISTPQSAQSTPSSQSGVIISPITSVTANQPVTKLKTSLRPHPPIPPILPQLLLYTASVAGASTSSADALYTPSYSANLPKVNLSNLAGSSVIIGGLFFQIAGGLHKKENEEKKSLINRHLA